MNAVPATRIAEIRQTAGLTQHELADRLGVHWVTLSKWERGKTPMTTDIMGKLSMALGCPLADLLPTEGRSPHLADPRGLAALLRRAADQIDALQDEVERLKA